MQPPKKVRWDRSEEQPEQRTSLVLAEADSTTADRDHPKCEDNLEIPGILSE